MVCSIVLLVTMASVNTLSVDLHVHEATAHAGEHHHGPALHHHDVQLALPSRESRLTAVDPDNTVIQMRLAASSASSPQPVVAVVTTIARAIQPPSSMTSGAQIIARAHGPPSFDTNSLRAPPRQHFSA